MIQYAVRYIKNATTGDKLYFPQAVLSGTMKLTDVATEVEKRSTVSSADVKAVLDALQFEVRQALADGHTVRLGDLGSFRPTLSAQGADDVKKATTSLIKRVRVRFTPSAALQAELSGVGQAGSKVKLLKKAEAAATEGAASEGKD